MLQAMPREMKATAKAVIGLGAAAAILAAVVGDIGAVKRFAFASVAVGAAGAVAASEVTSYASGTPSQGALSGPALVAEAGRELIQDRQGNVVLASEPQIINLEQGTQVVNNQNTEKIIQSLQAPRSLPPEVVSVLADVASSNAHLAREVQSQREARLSESQGPPIYITMNGKIVADLTGRRLSRNSRLTLTRGSA